MIRKIIKIDEKKCNGCGLCADACHERAIEMINGKAKLIKDEYCDGLGDCLPVCPTGAIVFEEREAARYDEETVKARMAEVDKSNKKPMHSGCPGSKASTIRHSEPSKYTTATNAAQDISSKLNQWPVQIKLVPVNASYFDNANLLVSADCAAYSYGNFHNEFMANKITLIGCPKLDMSDYSEKLTDIIKNNNIKSVTVARMEVPCCGGIENAVKIALKNSGKMIPWQVVTISTDGRILNF